MKAQIEKTLKDIVEQTPKGDLKDALVYVINTGGKRIRPLLFLKTLESYGIDPTPYLQVASSIEMIHTYSLVHDDLPAMDNDDLRRNQPTLHIKFDEATAILAGDALLSDAFKVLSTQTFIDEKTRLKLIEILATHSGSKGMVYGQSLDLFYENKDIPIEMLQEIHIHKTAKLIQTPLLMAGVIAKQNNLESLASLGEALGLVFQVQDDLLESLSDEKTMGKSLSDQDNGKTTYVNLLGIKKTEKIINNLFETIQKNMDAINFKDFTPLAILIDEVKNRIN